MADRVPQYPMLPTNFNPALAQHAQMAQQGQHPGLVDQQSVGGMMNPEQARMWPQMQQFLSQQRVQGGGEGMGPVNPQMNQQMMDFMRSNNMARAQGQQMMGQHQQPMNMGQGQMNSGQQFRDLQGTSQQMHPGFNPNFANAGVSNGQQFPVNLSQASAAMAARNPNFLAQMAANQGQMSRQLELIGLAQNQQPQNGPAGVAARLAQTNQQLQHMLQQHTQQGAGANLPQSQNSMAQSNFFAHSSMTPVPDIRQNSPPQVPSQHPMQMGHPQQEPQHSQAQRSMQRPVVPTAEQAVRALMMNRENLRREISAMTNEAQRLRNTVFPLTADAIAQAAKLDQQAAERNVRLEQVVKIISEFDPQKFRMQQSRNGAVPNPGLNAGSTPHPGSNGSPIPSQRPGLPMSAQTPVNWPGQQNMIPPSISNPQGAQPPTPVPPHLPAQFNNSQMNPSQIGQQSGMPQQQQQQPNPLTQRSLSAQGSMGQAAQPVNPAMMNNAPHAPMAKPDAPPLNPLFQTMPQELRAFVQKPIEPLEAQKFRETYTNFRNKKGITLDERMLKINDRSVDLHALHAEVIKEGGGNSVNQKDMWAVIGAKMGFIQFPATAREPAKAGPGVAQQLAHVYTLYLKDFDDLYTQTIFRSRLTQAREKMFAGTGQEPPRAPNLNQGPPAGQNRVMPAQLAQYTRFTAAQLRERGVPETVIQLIESYRPLAMQQAQQQEQFRAALRQNQAANNLPPNMQQRIPSRGPSQLVNQGQNFASGSGMSDPNRQVPTQGQPPMVGPMHSDMMNGAHSQVASAGNNNVPPISSVSRAAAAPQPVARRPTAEQVRESMAFVDELKRTHQANMLQNVHSVTLSKEQEQEYRGFFERLCRLCDTIEPNLGFFHAVWPREDTVPKILTVIHVKDVQRIHFSSPNPKFVVPLDKLKQMAMFVHNGSERFGAYMAALHQQEGIHQGPGPAPAPHGPASSAMPVPSAASPPPMSKTPVPPVPAASRAPQPQGSPVRRKHPPGAPIASTASTPPAVFASTPGTSAATPITITNSPQLGKSPKPRTTAKPKASAPPRRKASIKGGEAPIPDATTKRKREDVPLPEPETNAPSPPKKARTEWEEQPSQEIVRRQEEVENINTDEDAMAFFHTIQDLMEKQIGSNGALPSECSETLDGILKGYGGDSTGPDGTGIPGALDPSNLLVSSPDVAQRSAVDNFDAFFDFSSFSTLDEEVSVSKAPTPDLVASSSANPSPESGTDEPGGHGVAASTMTPKIAEANVDDLSYLNGPLRLGIFGEVDGGESLFYSSDNWKWEGLMPTSDPAWAISDS
ncbi:hypothetical protein NEOLEDRAFT_1127859 [Neolentinus lepideus HHB14362 ss-1]|uniref:ARID domain-containing protein n=1 Tax=Neolentinus lepideus HHB14362 ss-1 TaxID=1314782 RepID=A0A165VNQ8_9AGAM|nr:hypothetical protein NEOLEDRAFT_1127859 [Neolentinus lepideus HHB14362 ss-1]